MFELFVGLSFLFSCWVFGRSFLLICCADDGDWLAMPIGLCLVGFIATTLYFMFGLTAQSIQLLFLWSIIPCLVLVVYKGMHLNEGGRLLAVAGVFILLALPAFIGGEQYFVFRGNHWDHFNYINQTLTLWDNPYVVYQNATASNFLSKDVLVHGLTFINARPAVGLVLAICLPDGRGNVHLLAFLYVTALWALAFPAACFAWKRILEAYEFSSSGLFLLIGPPLAYVVGFWGQYIFDINAWSQMAALSLLLAFVFEYIRLLQKLLDPSTYGGRSVKSQYMVTGLLAMGAFLFYPENALVHAGLLFFTTILWCVITHQVPRFSTVVKLLIFSVVVLLIAFIPNWHETVTFMNKQIKYGSVQGPGFWKYFDRYWLGIHGDVLFSHIKPAVVHGFNLRSCFNDYWHELHLPAGIGYISTLANFILASIGMFFVAPDYSMPFWLRSAWILMTVILAMGAGYSLTNSVFRSFKVNQTAVFLKVFSILGILSLLYFLKKGSIFFLGEELAFLSPYFFLVLCLGLIETDKKMRNTRSGGHTFGNMIRKLFVIILILSQLAFGAYRLWKAHDPDGIGYDNLTYPSIQDTTMKTSYQWNMDPNAFAHCNGVNLYNVNDPFYREYMKQKFIYLKIPYFSSLPVMSYYAQGDQLGYQQPIVADCQMGLTRVADKWLTVKL